MLINFCVNPYAVQGIARDITIRKRAEEELLQTHDELEISARKRAEDLAHANRQLQNQINERKKAEEALRNSEEMYRSVVEQAHDGIAVVQDTVVKYANPQLTKMLGYSLEEAIGSSLAMYVHPDRLAEAIDHHTARMAGEEVPLLYETVLLHKDGRSVEAEVSGGLINYEGEPAGMITLRDITERKHAERVLRESEKKYRQLADLLPQTVFETDEIGNLTFANRIAFDLFGYTRGDFEKGLNALNMLAPEDGHRALENIDKVLRGKWLGGTEYTALTKEGNTFPVMIHTAPIISEDRTVGLRGVITDLTNLKETEETLRRSEERYRNLYNNAQVGIFRTGITGGKVLEANHRAAQICGYDNLDEFISEYLFSEHYVDPGTRERMLSEIQEKGEISNFEARFFRKDGSTIWGRYSARIYPEAGYLEGVVTDVTEEKESIRALQESEKKYRLLAENVTDVIWVSDMNFELTYVSPSVTKMNGYSVEEAMSIILEKMYTSESLEVLLKAFDDEIATEKTDEKDLSRSRTLELEGICKDGSTIWTEAKMTFLHDQDGQPVGILGVSRDISDRKRMEEEKAELEAQLQHVQKMEALGALAGGIAHDFNNLLMAIQGNASLMLLKKDPGDPDYRRLKNIEQYIQNSTELTKQLLGFARGGKYEVRPTDLNGLIRKNLEMFGRTKKEISIHTKYQEGISSVEIDRGQIEQVLMNLYINAWQAMPGGGKLFLETENLELDRNFVKPYGLNPGKYVKIAIADTGVGMDNKTRERIFDPFFTTKEMGRGIGLGLASAYGIIKNHGGIIDVSSRKGEGSTFSIYLPASEKEVPREEKLPEEVLTGEETILLVDDEEMIIDAGKEMLEEIGYTVLTATSGQQAIDAYRERKSEIHMVILDMIMPEMGGGETYDKLREVDPEIRVLLSSGYSVDGEATEILERGCNGFIQKPFDMKEIFRKIREILKEESGK